MSVVASSAIGVTGYCPRCDREHRLIRTAAAVTAVRTLVETLVASGRLDLDATVAHLRYRTELLFAPGGGKMLGVMLAEAPGGAVITLRAFSGQVGNAWFLDGWVPPVFDAIRAATLEQTYEPEIAAMTKRLRDGSDPALRARRSELSRRWTEAHQALYVLCNGRGERLPMVEAATHQGLATGTGDCCAPKLLQAATLSGLRPLGMAEVWLGAPGTLGWQSGELYAACTDKCGPIVGFMLCGHVP